MGLRERLRALRPAAPVGAPPLEPVQCPSSEHIAAKEPASVTDSVPRSAWTSGGNGPDPGSGAAPDGGTASDGGTDAASDSGSDRPPAIVLDDDMVLHSFPTPAGPTFGSERVYSLDYRQGSIPLHRALTVPDAGRRRLLPLAERPFPIEKALFLDLETTGLSRGAGTYAFLVGVGRFVEDGFRLRQFFMRDFSDEGPLLEALRLELADAEGLVTFNGRTFDWPLLETRATMNRLRLPLLPHLDVLHSARRMWQPIIGGCSLGRLETEVLGIYRHDDVPGHEIPQRYFDFLETGDAEPLAGVLHHNRLDILSMAALVARIGHGLAEPLGPEPFTEEVPESIRRKTPALSPEELFTVGRWLLPAPEGIRCLEAALARGLRGELRRRCSEQLVTMYKRTGRTDDAAALLRNMVREDGRSTWALIELAKHDEHRTRDLHAARQWTIRALELLRRRRQLQRAGYRGHSGTLTARIEGQMGAGSGSGGRTGGGSRAERGDRPGTGDRRRGRIGTQPDGVSASAFGSAPGRSATDRPVATRSEQDAVLHRLRRIERKIQIRSSTDPGDPAVGP